MRTKLGVTNPQSAELQSSAVRGTAKEHIYLNILDVGLLLVYRECQIRSLVKRRIIPAHALKYQGQICWKFRLCELLSWAEEAGAQISPEALRSLLSRENRSR